MAKYYASYNPSITGAAPVAGWYSTDIWPNLDYSQSGFLQLTSEQWANRNSGDYAIQNGALVAYNPTPVVVVIPLKTQAVTAQTWIQQQANLAAAMGEVFTADMKSYVKAIAAIANGTDTASTALPAQPTDVMTATSTSSTTTTTAS